MNEEDEEQLLKNVTLQEARSIYLARKRAEEELLRAQEALSKQSEWLRVTLTSIGDAVVTTDIEGKVLTLNRVAEELTGWTQLESLGRPLTEIFQIFNEETRKPVENPADRALQEGRVVGLANHTILISKNGTETPIDDSAAPIRDEEGRVHGVVLIFRSVAERKIAEKASRESEQQLSDFFENASIGLHWVGPDGTILRVNRSELNLLGYSLDEYLGHNIAEFHVDQNVIADILRRLSAGEILQDYPAQLRCRDGSIKDVLIDSSVFWRDGEFIHTRCITRDVTDRKHAERIQAQLAAIVQFSQDAIVSKTLEGVILSWNAGAERLFGYTAAEAVGKPITMLIPADRHDEERMILSRLRRGELIEHYETIRLTKEGRRVAVSLTISPLRDSAGRIIGASKIARDVTSKKRAEQRLKTQYAVTRTLAETESLEEAAPKVLGAICEHLEWRIGILWKIDDEAQVLRCFDVCHGGKEAPQFESESRKFIFKRGVGLPGRVWESGNPRWIDDVVEDKNFPRASAARSDGLHSGFGFPFRLDGTVLGVFEFFSDEIQPPDSELLELMAAIGSQIGQFIARKRVENLLRKSESRFRQLADAMPQIVWTARPDGFVDYYNERWYEFTGFPRDDDGEQSWETILHPADAERWKDTYLNSVKAGTVFQMEPRFKDRLTGGYRWFLCRAYPVTDEFGGILRWLGTCTDIDDTKRAEESSRFQAEASAALAELTDHESTLQKVASLAVPHFADWCTVDMAHPDGTIRRLAVAHVDPNKIHFITELQRKFPPRVSETRGVRQVIRTGRAEWAAFIPDEMLIEASQGEEHLAIIRELGLKSHICVPLKSHNQVLGALTFVSAESGRVYDLNDLRAAEDLANRAVIAIENSNLVSALKESDRRKDEFLAILAHELRNPLAPVRNAIHILRAKGPAVPELEWAREMIDRQIAQMTRLVDDLLDVSRITRGRIELRLERLDLRSVVNDAVEASRPFMEERGQTLSVEFPPKPIILDADPTRLAQVLQNLLNNAAKYMEEGGRVWLTVKRESEQVAISVKDTGVGIPATMLPHIFEMFTQVDRSSERSQGGLGIGLTLVERLVALHGGKVEARSPGLGKGSEFIVRLPIATDAKDAPKRQSNPEEPGVAPIQRRILVVDDNRDSAESMAMILRTLGHEVRTAFDGLAAIEVAEEFTPEVMLLDLGLPGLNGYKVAQRIRERRGSDVMLIALTGWGQEEDRLRSKEAGLDHHLTKPIEFDELTKLLAEIKPHEPPQTGGAPNLS